MEMDGESTFHFEENEDCWDRGFDVMNEGLNIEIDLDIPQLGLEFETEEDAYQFYLTYAKKVGFGIKRGKIHKDQSGKLLDRVFYCCAQGKRGKDKRDLYVKDVLLASLEVATCSSAIILARRDLLFVEELY